MNEQGKWWDSITNIVLIVMIVTLASLTFYSMVFLEKDIFLIVFGTFAATMASIGTFFFTKVTQKGADEKSLETEKNIKDASLAVPGVNAENAATTSTTTTTVQSESPIKKK